jgi:hypothetical protein
MQPLIILLAVTTIILTPAVTPAAPAIAHVDEAATLVLPPIVNGCAGTTCVETTLARAGDSVRNGAVIGAVLGGLALGGFAGFLCNALHEEGNPPCWKGVLTIAAVGAGIGAAAGAGIDALMSRTPQTRIPVVRKVTKNVAHGTR